VTCERSTCAQITHRVSWEEPVLPQRIEIDDEGGYIMTEAGEWLARCACSACCARSAAWQCGWLVGRGGRGPAVLPFRS
jgi:hypothetical protein